MMSLFDAQFSLSILGLSEIADPDLHRHSHVVSLVDPGTKVPLFFGDAGNQRHLLLAFHDALDDKEGRQAPTRADVIKLCQFTDAIEHSELNSLLVHCHMGRSRSAAAAAIMLIRLGCATPEDVFPKITAVRDPVWPNWTLLEHGDDVLGCNGALLAACEQLQIGVRARFPQWVADPKPEHIHLSAADQ